MVTDFQNIMVFGMLGSGKSTCLQALYQEDFDFKLQNKFQPSKSLSGFTQNFVQEYSGILNCMITDSPGLGDPKIPVNIWIDNFNQHANANNRVDLCVLVVEKKERVNDVDALTLILLDETIRDMTLANLCIVFNKCDEEEDSPKSVIQWYNEARKQAKCKYLPEFLKDDNILLLEKQPIGKKMQSLDQVPHLQKDLAQYIQQKMVAKFKEKLTNTKKLQLLTTSFENIFQRAASNINLEKMLGNDDKFNKSSQAKMKIIAESQNQIIKNQQEVFIIRSKEAQSDQSTQKLEYQPHQPMTAEQQIKTAQNSLLWSVSKEQHIPMIQTSQKEIQTDAQIGQIYAQDTTLGLPDSIVEKRDEIECVFLQITTNEKLLENLKANIKEDKAKLDQLWKSK